MRSGYSSTTFASTCAKTRCIGYTLDSATRTRRTLTVTTAPIFSNFVRIVPQVASASSVPRSPTRRKSLTRQYATDDSHSRIWFARSVAVLVRSTAPAGMLPGEGLKITTDQGLDRHVHTGILGAPVDLDTRLVEAHQGTQAYTSGDKHGHAVLCQMVHSSETTALFVRNRGEGAHLRNLALLYIHHGVEITVAEVRPDPGFEATWIGGGNGNACLVHEEISLNEGALGSDCHPCKIR